MPRRRARLESLPPQLQQVNLNAAAIDIGSTSHFVAVPEGRDSVSVREFGTFTADLHLLADWLQQCGIDTVVMESTGVYWIPVFELLEQRGFEVLLVDARKVKNVSGRKSDVLDCQWLQQLHTFGLLQGAFRPAVSSDTAFSNPYSLTEESYPAKSCASSKSLPRLTNNGTISASPLSAFA